MGARSIAQAGADCERPARIDATTRLWSDSVMAFDRRIRLPHTDLVVGRVGLGSSFGVGPDGLELAFDHGINYFYWGSIRRPGFGRGIRALARRGREKIAVALQSYTRWPPALMRLAVESGLRRLQLDHADVLLLGWWNQRPPQWILDTALELREQGRVRYLMMSGHRRVFFPEMAREGIFDLFMVRYNAAHRGAEEEVFPRLPTGQERPGVCAYTATRWGSLVDARKVPTGERVPRASDCYRFCLTNPAVDMVMCGPANAEQVREACTALEKGPLDADELAWMQRVGDHVYGRSPVRSLAD
jgi:aryl-alcohol dehydrogenase-like predicted oxidoreductase